MAALPKRMSWNRELLRSSKKDLHVQAVLSGVRTPRLPPPPPSLSPMSQSQNRRPPPLHTPSIAFRHLPPKEGCRKPVLGVCLHFSCPWAIRLWNKFPQRPSLCRSHPHSLVGWGGGGGAGERGGGGAGC